MVKIISLAKMLLVALSVFSFSESAFAQSVDEVTLTVSGDGATKTVATNNALRSAVEQAFGVFVSANTAILNDALVTDEIATVSSGNIKKYDEIASLLLPNGKTSVTLKAIVSISKLTKYTESHGSAVEFAGATFGVNMKLKELNKENEEKAISNLIVQLKALAPTIYDYELNLEEPKLSTNDKGIYNIDFGIVANFNPNTEIFDSILLKTLESLSIVDLGDYKRSGVEYNKIVFENAIQRKTFNERDNYVGSTNIACHLRSKISCEKLKKFLTFDLVDAILNFKIIDNLQGVSSVSVEYGVLHREFINNGVQKIFENYDKTKETIKTQEFFLRKFLYSGLIKHYYYESDNDYNNISAEYIELYKGYHPWLGEYLPSCYILTDDEVETYYFSLLNLKTNGCKFKLKLVIPKDDISKYSKFTIERKSTTL